MKSGADFQVVNMAGAESTVGRVYGKAVFFVSLMLVLIAAFIVFLWRRNKKLKYAIKIEQRDQAITPVNAISE